MATATNPPQPELIGFGDVEDAARATNRVRELLAAARMAILPLPDDAQMGLQRSPIAIGEDPLQYIADDIEKILHVLQNGAEADRVVAAAALEQVRERLAEIIRNHQ